MTGSFKTLYASVNNLPFLSKHDNTILMLCSLLQRLIYLFMPCVQQVFTEVKRNEFLAFGLISDDFENVDPPV